MRVTQVVDGDTVDVCCPQARVRLLGIDTPERGEWLFQEATAMTARLTSGQQVRMERCEEDEDQYGRLLRHLFVGERHVNRELVAAGLAQAYISRSASIPVTPATYSPPKALPSANGSASGSTACPDPLPPGKRLDCGWRRNDGGGRNPRPPAAAGGP